MAECDLYNSREERLALKLEAIDDIANYLRGVAHVGISRARTRLQVVIHEDCDRKRREREVEWEAREDSDVEMLL